MNKYRKKSAERKHAFSQCCVELFSIFGSFLPKKDNVIAMTFTFLLQVDFQFQSENFLIGLIDIHLVRYDNIFQGKWPVRLVKKEY